MDGFCINDNDNGGRCLCSPQKEKLDTEFLSANTELEKEIRATEAAIDIVQNKRNPITKSETTPTRTSNARARAAALYMESEPAAESDDISSKKGSALLGAAQNLCTAQIGEDCGKYIFIIQPVYNLEIKNDCAAYQNKISNSKKENSMKVAAARVGVRQAALSAYDAKNKYDLGGCMLEYKKCFTGGDVCGPDWKNCMTGLSESLMTTTYGISSGTLDQMDAKKNICEYVLNQCETARPYVWDAFLKLVSADIYFAESLASGDMRQSCLSDISDCIVKSCQDDIEAKGKATMDACLSRPEMAKSFCKVQIDPCEKIEPQIWNYATAKLAAMRVDRCTEEVRECFQSDNACGPDMTKCLGLDYNALHKICPLDKLVVCKENNPKFAFSDLDNIIAGLYLGIDNSFLEKCQSLAWGRMQEICGGTMGCNAFANDKIMGAGSLAAGKEYANHIISGTIFWNGINVSDGKEWTDCKSANADDSCDAYPRPGELLIDEYMEKLNGGVNSRAMSGGEIKKRIRSELEDIKAKVDRINNLLDQDTELQYCLYGRDLSQITGKKNDKSNGRFPALMSMPKRIVAETALATANENYNRKLAELMDAAAADADIQAKEYMCLTIPTLADTRGMTEPELSDSEKQGKTAYSITKIIAKSEDTRSLEIMAAKHTIRQQSDIIKTEKWAAFEKETCNCHIETIETFHGKRKIVNELLKRPPEKFQKIDKTGIAATAGSIGLVGGAALSAAALTAVGTGAVAASAAAAATAAGTSAALAGMAASVAATTAATTAAAATAAAATAASATGLAAAGAGLAATAATGVATTAAAAVGTTAAAATAASATAAAATSSAIATAGTAAAASATVPVVGWIAAGVIVTGIILCVAIFCKNADPNEQIITETRQYGEDIPMGTGRVEKVIEK
ncbi:MAG: hypothetical protein LBJ18_02990 [Rickettsiales bacterium]|jgi:hypothetical protein|nr:hypothetical protein [Rickettsiales bacterium]